MRREPKLAGDRRSRSMQRLRDFLADERGTEGIERALIIAAVVLPVLGLLIWLGIQVGLWVKENWDLLKIGRGTPLDNP